MVAVIAGRNLKKTFEVDTRRRSGIIHAVNDVDIDLAPGEVVGLVGESGCGKSTLSRLLVRLDDPDDGEVLLDGAPVVTRDDWRELRRTVQYVFQDPYGSLCPTMTIRNALAEPLLVHKVVSRRDAPGRVAAMLDLVGLRPDLADRLPSQLSGGQRQRVALARALMLEPRGIICDEIVSGLDVSVQAQVLNLLLDLRDRLSLSLLFISHDLSVVKYLCDRVVVMYLGQVVEEGPVEEVFADPQHPYTAALIAAIPDHERLEPGELTQTVPGEAPSLLELPPGCLFADRCSVALPTCSIGPPPVVVSGKRRVRCVLASPKEEL